MKKISLIIPTKNRPEYLRECLSSLICQDANFEVILVDDGNVYPEHTLRLFHKMFPIKYIKSPENHLKDSCLVPIRIGMNMADGDYVKIVGDDDWLEPHSLDIEYKFMEDHLDHYDGLITSYYRCDDKLQVRDVYQVHAGITKELMRYGCYIPDAMLTKRVFWDKLDWNEEIGSRWLWLIWWQMICKGVRVGSVPELCTYRYRLHDKQITHEKDNTEDNNKLKELMSKYE